MPIAQSVVDIDPDIMGGEPVFMGARVPIQIFWDYLEDNAPLDEFLLDYPTREARAVPCLARFSAGTITKFSTRLL